MDLNQILVEALSQEASDIHIKAGAPQIFRVNGALKAWNKLKPFDLNDVSKIAFDLMNDWQKERLSSRIGKSTCDTKSMAWADSGSMSFSSEER